MNRTDTFRAFAGVILASALLAGQPAREPETKSPEVSPDGRITFRLRAPDANSVKLNASWYQGPKDMTKDAAGVWSATIGPVATDIYNYTYSIDGVTTIDPHNAAVKTGVRPASSVVDVPGEAPRIFDLRDVPHGSVRIHYYASKSAGMTRRLHVYAPPGYDNDKGRRYPVLYLLHGAGDDDSGWMTIGRANLIFDNLIADGKCQPMLVVMPFGHVMRGGDWNVMREVRNRQFDEDLTRDIVPFIDANYRTRKDADSRAVAGLSMGGGQSARAGLGHPGMFHWVGLFSAAVMNLDEHEGVQSFFADPEKANRALRLLWIGCGKDDFLIEINRKFVARLEEKGIRHTWRLTDGDHSWPVWRRYLAELAPLLFVKTAGQVQTSSR
ncbi:MAG: esterase [Bryobacteraceae bacterium]|nr:esterase [Bryobacteraceae bacterium]